MPNTARSALELSGKEFFFGFMTLDTHSTTIYVVVALLGSVAAVAFALESYKSRLVGDLETAVREMRVKLRDLSPSVAVWVEKTPGGLGFSNRGITSLMHAQGIMQELERRCRLVEVALPRRRIGELRALQQLLNEDIETNRGGFVTSILGSARSMRTTIAEWPETIAQLVADMEGDVQRVRSVA